jgi:hypothetical protein
MLIKTLIAGGLLILFASQACRFPGSAGPDPMPMARATGGVAEPVEGQLEAYNAHDLEQFLSHYAPDVELHKIVPNGTSVVRGLDAMRQSYAFLDNVPAGFRAEIVSRMVAGRYVIDHERISVPDKGSFEGVAIYEVKDKTISRVWFLPEF